MAKSSLVSPQLVINSRMVYSSWIPADPDACARFLPQALEPAGNHAIYMNQYVVDSAQQTTGFGAYSLTYLGLDVGGLFAPDGATPARFFTHYINSSESIREYVEERGVATAAGTTTLEIEDGVVTATTHSEGRAIIRTRAAIGDTFDLIAAGHLRYITKIGGKLVSGLYPYIGELANSYNVLSIEFLDPSHPVYALRPADPLQVIPAACFYSPRNSFVYPGGVEEMGNAEGNGPKPR